MYIPLHHIVIRDGRQDLECSVRLQFLVTGQETSGGEGVFAYRRALRDFIGEQAMFFVATAPSEGGRINLSPKGYSDTLAVIDDHTVAYLDLFGSGVETIAHLRDNGRITMMLCSFTRNSRTLRLFGTGRVVR